MSANFTFELVDEDDEPNTWATIGHLETPYQSIKLLHPLSSSTATSAPSASLSARKPFSASVSLSLVSDDDDADDDVGDGSDASLSKSVASGGAAAAAVAVRKLVDDPLNVLREPVSTDNSMDSATFDPSRFLAEHHANTSYEDLLAGRKYLSRSLRSEEQQIKQLVANNFDKFIQSKDTIDAVVAQIRLHEARAGGVDASDDASKSSNGATEPLDERNGTEQLEQVYDALTARAGRLYRPILAKLTESGRLQALVTMIERFQFLFSLPQRVRRNISLNEKEKVLRDYEKARRLVQSTSIELFHKIFAEIETQIRQFIGSLYTDLAQLDLNTQRDEVDRIIRLIEEFNAIVADNSSSKAEHETEDDEARFDGEEKLEQEAAALSAPQRELPTSFYLRHRFATLERWLRAVPLAELRSFVLTHELEFVDKNFDVAELLSNKDVPDDDDDAAAAAADADEQAKVDAGDTDEMNNALSRRNAAFDAQGDAIAELVRRTAFDKASAFTVVGGVYRVLNAFASRVEDAAESADDSGAHAQMRTALAALASLVAALRARSRPGQQSNPSMDTAAAAAAAAAAVRNARQSRSSRQRRGRSRTAPISPWIGPILQLVERSERYVLRRARRVLSRHTSMAFGTVRKLIVAAWHGGAQERKALERAAALLSKRRARQQRFEQSLRLTSFAENKERPLDVDSGKFLSSARALDTRQLRERLAQARRLLLVHCFRPLRDASLLLSATDVLEMRVRVNETLELLVELLRSDAADDDNGLRVLAALATVDYVRSEYIDELLALFVAQFAGVSGVKGDVRVAPVLLTRLQELDTYLTRAYVRVHMAPVDSIVTDGLLRSGTNWFYFEETRLPRVNDYVIKLLLRLVVTHNQLATRCSARLNEILARMLDGVLASFMAALPSIECFDKGGLLQLLIDIAFVEQTLAQYFTRRSRRLLESIHRRLSLEAKAANCKETLESRESTAYKREALKHATKGTRVLFLCFAGKVAKKKKK